MRVVDLNVSFQNDAFVASGYEDRDGMRYSIEAQGATWDGLKADLCEVVNAIYYDTAKPDRVALHLHHDEEVLFA